MSRDCEGQPVVVEVQIRISEGYFICNVLFSPSTSVQYAHEKYKRHVQSLVPVDALQGAKAVPLGYGFHFRLRFTTDF